ncbi:MAG TPA: hypothetical protein PK299_15485 [Anaerolineales bacterium]|nr:hypothetical protein [Anaerolineales bacterium]
MQDKRRNEIRARQISGMILGVIIGLMTANFFPALRSAIGGWAMVLLWSVALGGLVGSLTDFYLIGQRITKRENRTLNNIVGLGLLVVVIGIVLLIANLL